MVAFTVPTDYFKCALCLPFLRGICSLLLPDLLSTVSAFSPGFLLEVGSDMEYQNKNSYGKSGWGHSATK